ncbi:alpha/beta hydrolase family protein [Piscinibacter sakaiensis]|uniref:alpha/beta hydrolase family protein n=1 Tax=Piscinibacter sakaiensis TaxID=1547922 RepID=UPI003AB0F4A1
MKVLRLTLLAAAVLVTALLAYALSRAFYTDRPVGFQRVVVTDPAGRPMTTGIWYPTESTPLPTTLLSFNLISVAKDAAVSGARRPLILISHGNGGGPGSHVDLALALAQKGFIVAAPMHAGDNFADQSAAGSVRWLPDRVRQIRSVLDYMQQQWPSRAQIDERRVGIFGFSAGAFTALASIGGEPDLSLLASHCLTTPEFVCQLLKDARSPLLDPAAVPVASEFAADGRIKAAVLVAPGLGFSFPASGLTAIGGPVQVWTGSADTNVPTTTNARPISEALGGRAELREVAGASHFSFLAPCRLFGPPVFCRDADGFDRERAHLQMNDAIAEFFGKAL